MPAGWPEGVKRRRHRAGRVEDMASVEGLAEVDVLEEEEEAEVGEGANAIVDARSSGVASTASGSFS